MTATGDVPLGMGRKNAATLAMEAAVSRVHYEDWMQLRIEVDSIRCRSSLFKMDEKLIRELLELREFRDKHSIASKPNSPETHPKSALIRHAEAHAIFGEYCDRESRRLAEKLQLMEAGAFIEDAQRGDSAERARNEAIGQRAVDAEAHAARLKVAGDIAAIAPQNDLFAE